MDRAPAFTLLYLAVTTAKLCGPGGVRAVIAENLLLKQQLIVLRRARQRAPNLMLSDRLLCGLGSLFLSPGRIRKVAIGVRPSTLLAFSALVRRNYRRLFASSPCPQQPEPKGRAMHSSTPSSSSSHAMLHTASTDCAHHHADVRGRHRHGRGAPRHLSTNHDPLFEAHRWTANLRILEIDEVKTVPHVPRHTPSWSV